MNLRELAEQDLGAILEDGAYGFGWSITLTNPAGQSASFTGYSDDIAQIIDPDTGEAVSGRLASAVLRLSSIYAAGLGVPVGIHDKSSKPWLIQFDDINGVPYTFKVDEGNPDRALGVVACILSVYNSL